MKISKSFRGLSAALALFLALMVGGCAGSRQYRAVAAVDVAPDGRVEVQEFLHYPPAGHPAELEKAIAAQQLRALPGREWRGVWSTHAYAEYRFDNGRFDLQALHLDPLLVGVVPPSFSSGMNEETGQPLFSMRYEIVRPVTPYRVKLVPPPNVVMPTRIMTGPEVVPLRFNLDADGVPRDAQVAQGFQGSAQLAEILIDTLRQWRFAPDRIDGRPVASEGLVAYITVMPAGSELIYVYDDLAPRLRAPHSADNN